MPTAGASREDGIRSRPKTYNVHNLNKLLGLLRVQVRLLERIAADSESVEKRPEAFDILQNYRTGQNWQDSMDRG